jgi:hypothetical protein
MDALFLGWESIIVTVAGAMQRTIKIILLMLMTSTSLVSYSADDDPSSPTFLKSGFGAVYILVVAAGNPQTYNAYLRQNTEIFESRGMLAAGTCATQTGNDYAGQMFVWGVYDSVQSAMEESSSFDYDNTTRKLRSLRDAKYTSLFKSLKIVNLASGFERMMRLRVKPQDLDALILAAHQFEAEAQSAGSKIQVGLFAPIGGGANETGMVHMRLMAASASDLGAAHDTLYANPIEADSGYGKIIAMAEIVTDNLEICELIYSEK